MSRGRKPLYVIIARALHDLALVRVSGLRPDLDLYWRNYLKRCSEQFPRPSVNHASVDTTDANSELIVINGTFDRREVTDDKYFSAPVQYRIEVTPNLRDKFNVAVTCDDKELMKLLIELYEDGLRRKVQLN